MTISLVGFRDNKNDTIRYVLEEAVYISEGVTLTCTNSGCCVFPSSDSVGLFVKMVLIDFSTSKCRKLFHTY